MAKGTWGGDCGEKIAWREMGTVRQWGRWRSGQEREDAGGS